MSLHNVTPTTFDHHCSAPDCQHKRLELAHSEAVIVETVGGGKVITITCPDGHVECLNNSLPAWEETSPTRTEEGREQVRNNRLLHKHLGLPVK